MSGEIKHIEREIRNYTGMKDKKIKKKERKTQYTKSYEMQLLALLQREFIPINPYIKRRRNNLNSISWAFTLSNYTKSWKLNPYQEERMK